MTRRRIRIPLAAKLLAMALLVSVVPLAALGFSLIDVNRDALVQTNQDLLFAVVDDVAGDLEAELAGTQRGLQAVARTLADDTLADDARIAVALSLVAADPHLGAVGIYGEDGALIDTLRAEGEVALPERLPTAARESAARGLLGLGEVEAAADGARILVAAPIATPAASWFAAARVSLAPLQDRVEQIGDLRFGGRGEVFAVDTRLRALVHTDRERALRLESLTGQGILDGVDGDAIDEGLLLFGEFTGADGVAQVGALRTLEGAPWAVVAQLPRAVAYASLERTRKLVAIVVGVLALIAIGVATLLAQRITAPLRTLVRLARDLAARRFDRRAEVRSNDEVGVLADALNGAASDLEESEARLIHELEIRADLRRYLPAQLVDRIVERSQDAALGGERRSITVVFADVAGFTALAENRPPERVVELLNELFTLLTELVYRHGGTVDKFMGDCIMAFWGAPEPVEDHASRGLRAAEDMQRLLDIGNARWQQRYGATIHLAIGVATGDAIVGNFGSETRMEYTAIGDVVNVAARLEMLARPQQILITGETRSKAGDGFEYLPLGEHRVAGRMRPIEVFELRS